MNKLIPKCQQNSGNAFGRIPYVNTSGLYDWGYKRRENERVFKETVADPAINKVKEAVKTSNTRTLHKNAVRAKQLGKPGYGVSTATNDQIALQEALYNGGFAPKDMTYEKFVDGWSNGTNIGKTTQAALDKAVAAGYDEALLRKGKLVRKKGWVDPETLKKLAANTQKVLENVDLSKIGSDLYNNHNWFDTAVGAAQTAGAFANSVFLGVGKRTQEKLDEIEAPSWLGKGVRTALDNTIGRVNLDAANPVHGGTRNAEYSDKIGRLMVGTVLPRVDKEEMRKAHEAGKDYTITITDSDWKNAGVGVTGDGLVDKAINHPARYTAGASKVTFKPDGSVVAEDTGDYDFNYEEGGGSGLYSKVRRAAYNYGARESDDDIRKTHYSRTYNIVDLIQ